MVEHTSIYTKKILYTLAPNELAQPLKGCTLSSIGLTIPYTCVNPIGVTTVILGAVVNSSSITIMFQFFFESELVCEKCEIVVYFGNIFEKVDYLNKKLYTRGMHSKLIILTYN